MREMDTIDAVAARNPDKMVVAKTWKQIDQALSNIILFAGVDEFIDVPVRYYSSGMYTRLAFSVATSLPGEILLVDEILSVGDAEFREKSSRKMLELINDEGKTVILVSHSAKTLRRVCNQIVWLDKGTVKMMGPTASVMDEYQRFVAELSC